MLKHHPIVNGNFRIPSLPDGSTLLEELFARGLRGAERHVSEIDRAVKEVSLAPDVPKRMGDLPSGYLT